MREGLDGMMVPSKFYGILGASRPAIFVGPEGSEIAACIREEDCGEVVPLGDVDGLAAAIRGLAADSARRRELGERGHAALVRRHSRSVRVAEWEELLTSLAPNAPSGSR
jgi:glycosyltransferase involved in cell wall biosynthesis